MCSVFNEDNKTDLQNIPEKMQIMSEYPKKKCFLL